MEIVTTDADYGIVTVKDDIDFNSPVIQGRMLEMQAQRCNNGSTPRAGWCPETWDSILCWPPTAPNELAVLSCPHYIAGFDLQANATRQCMSDGQWYWSAETNSTWSNYTECYNTPLVTVLMDLPDMEADNATLVKKYLPVVKIISTVGYAVSLSALIVAFCILATIKKLRCPRNMLHMHLFASFITRAFMALLKEIIFISGLGLSSDVLIKNGESYWLDHDIESNWHCKAFTSFWQYAILANYSWILMEGLYLHNLVFFALFTDSNSSIAGYVALGWGLPLVFVLPWISMRACIEDTFCWTINLNPYVFSVIRIPTTLSIVINFALFVNIVRVLYLKLKSAVCEETHRYRRWARNVTTRGCSLASSRGYLDSVDHGHGINLPDGYVQTTNQASPLRSKYTDQSMLSFYSNISEGCGLTSNLTYKIEPSEHHRWSDSECCSLSFELHNFHPA
ncbi:Similar to PTH1R: Parathyroid hormone/parathyroid hormone-related peptide receptor (Bos taurus) [Cotesia congregata]|uniref:Similar to PTH1R: Parathyroid hormone/parathyroid hormone-related peptide receptor (Bos taurus) n=1 Tax=Cotesia congregata TaxID=51543 RepID=A0A8J2HPJ4_COTCN|nr:Similar to PTH1R: Parathyroid hormone/parathyroid hormone-related peptide receptor (Bos taurus) [Cotesia congregata]